MTSEPVRTWSSNAAAEVWRQGAARRAQTLAEVTEQMFAAVGLQAGQHVLDIAAGTGDQSLLAAQRVTHSGSILATDISPNMLELAAQSAREAGLDNVRTQVADASSLDVPEASFDAAICRFGLMFVPDVQAALVRARCALKPGARFAALVWSSEAQNPYIGLPLQLIREMDRMPSPPPSLARTVSLSGPGRLDAALREAGFSDVSVRPLPTPRAFESLDEALKAMQSGSPAQGELTASMSDDERAHFAAELEQRLRAYVRADGTCVLPGEALLGSGANA